MEQCQVQHPAFSAAVQNTRQKTGEPTFYFFNPPSNLYLIFMLDV